MTCTEAQPEQSELTERNGIDISQDSVEDFSRPRSLSSSAKELPELRSIALGRRSSISRNLTSVGNEDEPGLSCTISPESTAYQLSPQQNNSTESPDKVDHKRNRRRWVSWPSYLLLQWTFTFLWCSGTAVYASLAHREQPLAIPILTNPQFKIAFLALLCAGSGVFIFHLILKTLEDMRWRLVCRGQGMGMYNFIGTSPSTNVFQICRLIYFDPEMKGSLARRLKNMFHRHGWNLQRLLLQILTAGLSLVLIVFTIDGKDTYTPYTTKRIITGMPTFNSTPWIPPLKAPPFLERVIIQERALASSSSRTTNIDDFHECRDPTCSGVRIHANLQDIYVPSDTWTPNDGLPTQSQTWRSTFDTSHDWDYFKVDNSSTVQIEFSELLNVTEGFGDTDCQVYGYPYLALKICLKQDHAPHHILIATSYCVDIATSECFLRRDWMDIFNMTCQAFLYRLYSSIVYRRIDGLIISSNPTTTLNPTPFSIPDLFAIYNASFGIAELASAPQSLTSEVISSIRYHTVESLIDFLSQVQVSRSGTRDYYWGSAAVRGLILPMYMDFINVVPVDFVVRGSSAFKSFPLIIPVPAVVVYGSCVLYVLRWSMGCIAKLRKMKRLDMEIHQDLEAFKSIFPGRDDYLEGERDLVLMGDYWWPLWGKSSEDIARKASGMVVYAKQLEDGKYGLFTLKDHNT